MIFTIGILGLIVFFFIWLSGCFGMNYGVFIIGIFGMVCSCGVIGAAIAEWSLKLMGWGS